MTMTTARRRQQIGEAILNVDEVKVGDRIRISTALIQQIQRDDGLTRLVEVKEVRVEADGDRVLVLSDKGPTDASSSPTVPLD
jgi:hypothetical protein